MFINHEKKVSQVTLPAKQKSSEKVTLSEKLFEHTVLCMPKKSIIEGSTLFQNSIVRKLGVEKKS